jgi:hypothetical protein
MPEGFRLFLFYSFCTQNGCARGEAQEKNSTTLSQNGGGVSKKDPSL